MNDARYIPLYTRDRQLRGVCTIDAADYEWALKFYWHVIPSGYVRRMAPKPGGGQIAITMHRELLGLEPGEPLIVDHINRNPLDNRRSNLRIGTRGMNTQNVGPCRGAKSRFRGVFPRYGRFRVMVQLDGKLHRLGTFDDELEAARVASDWRREHMPWAVEEEIAA